MRWGDYWVQMSHGQTDGVLTLCGHRERMNIEILKECE